MANFEKVYSIGFNAQKALKSLDAFEKRFAKLDKKLMKIGESFAIFNRAISQNQGKAVASLDKMDDSLKSINKQTTQAGKKIQKLLGVQARKPINKTSKALTALGRKGLLATQRIEQGAKGAARGIRRIGAVSKGAQRSIAGLITKIGLFIGAAQGIRSVVSTFMDFDRSMTLAGAKFSAINKDMAPGTAAFKDFRKEIRAAAVDTEHTASAVAGAVDFWAKAGKTASQTKAVIPVTLDFASANTDATGAALDMARAGDILSDALGQFKLDTADPTQLMANTARVADVMSKAANSANVSAEELFESYKQAGPVLSAVGGDIEETSALLATMANAGLKGSIAGRSLKIATAALNAPSAKQAALMQRLGVQVKTAEGDMNSLTNVIGQLDKATAKMGEADRFEAFATVFGREGVTGFLNLVAKGEADIAGLTERLRDAGGETKRLAEIIRKSASAQMQRFWNKLSEIGFEIIEETRLFDRLGAALKRVDWKSVSKFITERLIPAFLGVAQAIKNYILPVVGVLSDAFGMVLGPAIDFITGRFNRLNKNGASFKSALDSIVKAIPGITTEWISRLSTEFSAFVMMFQNSLWNMQELFNGFARGTSREWDSTIGHLSALGNTLLSSYNDVFQELKALFLEVVSIFLGGTDDIEEDWYQTGDRMSSDIADTVKAISAIISTIAQVAGAVFSALIRVVTVAVAGIRSSFENLFGGILDIAEGNFLRGFARIGVAIADAITLPVRAAFGGLLKLVSKIPGAKDLAASVGVDLDYMGDIVKEGFGGLVPPETEKAIAFDDNRGFQGRGAFAPEEDLSYPSFHSDVMDDIDFGQTKMPDFQVPDLEVTPNLLETQSVGAELQNELSKLNANIETLRPTQQDSVLQPFIDGQSEQLKLQESMAAKTESFQQKMLEATQQQAKAKSPAVNIDVAGSSYVINANGADAQEVGRIVRREMAAGERRQRSNMENAARSITFGEQ
jgi:TP901 family phage tail tape measure protein